MGIDAGAIRELTEALDGKRPAQQPTVARARVVQADGGGTWVQLDGGAARTPVASSTVAVRQGDEVLVRIDGGNAVVTGNISRPSTDDSALNVLERTMDTFTRRVSDLNGNVSEIRQSADSIATRVENVEGSVASMEQTAEGWSWVTSVKNQSSAAASTASEAQSTANAASTAAGNAATAAANAQSSADEAAKTATNYMSFTNQGLVIGDMTEEKLGRNVCINDGGVHVFYEGSTEGVNEIAHLGYGEGNAESGTANAPYYTFGTRNPNYAVGNYSIVEGGHNAASALFSHAEGHQARATAPYSHAEGFGTVASGFASHAEGEGANATGSHSHASGSGTIAAGSSQTAIGKYNGEDTAGKYAFIVGNGASTSARSNALTVDWDGNVEASGAIYANGTPVSLLGHNHTKGQVGFDGYVSDVTTTHETFSGYTIQKSGTTTSPGYYRTISKKPSSPGTGYEAIGIVGVYTNHYATVMVGGYYIDSSGAVNVQLRNHGSSKYTDLNVDVIVLWRKRY